MFENQEKYNKALQSANNAGESTVFIEFMLSMIRDALNEISMTQNKTNVVKTSS